MGLGVKREAYFTYVVLMVSILSVNCIVRECQIRNVMWNGNTARGSFEFVYLLACECGMEAELWRTAFNAQCLIAFATPINNFNAKDFNSKFWECISGGQSIFNSANTAAQYAGLSVNNVAMAGTSNIKLKE